MDEAQTFDSEMDVDTMMETRIDMQPSDQQNDDEVVLSPTQPTVSVEDYQATENALLHTKAGTTMAPPPEQSNDDTGHVKFAHGRDRVVEGVEDAMSFLGIDSFKQKQKLKRTKSLSHLTNDEIDNDLLRKMDGVVPRVLGDKAERKGFLSQITVGATALTGSLFQESLKRASKALGKAQKRAVQRSTVATLFVVFWFALAIIALLTLTDTRFQRDSKSYPSDKNLTIEVNACDIDLRPTDGSDFKVKVSRFRLLPEYVGSMSFSDHKVTASNKNCNYHPSLRCREACLVTVHVPEADHDGKLIILQKQVDAPEAVMIENREPMTIGSADFIISGYYMHVQLRQAVMRTFDIQTATGFIDIRGARFPDDGTIPREGLARSQKGNVYLEVDPAAPPMQYNIRQNDHNICLQLDDDVQLLSNTTSCDPNATDVFYDPDDDGLVTYSDFTNAMVNRLPKCCILGGLCDDAESTSNRCDKVADKIYGSDSTDRTALTVEELIANLTAAEDTTLFPGCTESYAVQSGLNHRITLLSDQGQIQVRHIREGQAVVPNRVPGAPSIMNMVPTSVRKLRGIGEEVNSSTADVFATILVRSHVDLEPDLFYYSSRKLFYQLPPAYLQVVGAWPMVPQLRHISVDFTLGQLQCDIGIYDPDILVDLSGVNRTIDEFRLANLYTQLSEAIDVRTGLVARALDEDGPRSSLPLLGVLSSQIEVVQGVPKLTQFETVETEIETTDESQSIIVLNIILALLAGIAATFSGVWVYGRKKMKELEQQQKTNAGAAGNLDGEARPIPIAKRVRVYSWTNPLEYPMHFLNIIVPYRAVIVNSLKRFFEYEFIIDKSDSLKRKGVPFKEFVDRYSAYCAAKSLPEQTEPGKIRKFLTVDIFEKNAFGCRKVQCCASYDNSKVDDIDNPRNPIRIRVDSNQSMFQGLRLRYPDRDVATLITFFAEMENTIQSIKNKPFNEYTITPQVRRHVNWYRSVKWLNDEINSMSNHKIRPAIFHFLMICVEFRDDFGQRAQKQGEGVADKTYLTTSGHFLDRFVEFLKYMAELQTPYQGLYQNVLSELQREAWDVNQVNQDQSVARFVENAMIQTLSDSFKPLGVETLENVTLREIVGIRYRRNDERIALSASLLKEFCLEAFVSCILVFTPIFLIITSAVLAQDVYAATNGVPGTSDNPATKMDIFHIPGDTLDEDYYVASRFLLGWSFFMIALSAITLFLARLQFFKTAKDTTPWYVTLGHILWKALSVVFAWSFTFSIAGALMYIFLIILWLLASALVDPENNMVASAGAILVVVIILFIQRQIRNARTHVKMMVYDNLDDKLRKFIVARLETLNSSIEENVLEDVDENSDLADLFSTLNRVLAQTDEDEPMTKAEYFVFMDDLGFKIPNPTKERMFAFADENGNGTIEMNELSSTWDYFKLLMFERTAARLGLTELQLFITVVTAVSVFLALFIFLYLVIKTYGEEDGFSSVITTIYLGVISIVTLVQRSKSLGENLDPKMLDKFIAEDMNNKAGVTGKVAQTTVRVSTDFRKHSTST